jgi:uncharacterized protein (DUF4415 family)
MKDATTGKTSKASKARRGTDWEALRRMSDVDIHAGIVADPDAHPTDERFWQDAKIVLPHRKEVVTMRLDVDVLAWFRQQRGYQTRINAILRAYMKAHEADAQPRFRDATRVPKPIPRRPRADGQ